MYVMENIRVKKVSEYEYVLLYLTYFEVMVVGCRILGILGCRK